jgi:hypothetical protein
MAKLLNGTRSIGWLKQIYSILRSHVTNKQQATFGAVTHTSLQSTCPKAVVCIHKKLHYFKAVVENRALRLVADDQDIR